VLISDRPPASEQVALSEATLARLWAGQRFPSSVLVTRQGVPLRVLRPGRCGRGAGPDFRDALIAAPSGTLLRGDVELHTRASGFRAHGHHRDRRYDSVVLHVVFEDDLFEDTLLANGRRAPVVALAPWLNRRAQELTAWLSQPSHWREPCYDAVARLGQEQVLQRLHELGDRRFRQQEAALAVAISSLGPGEALYRSLLAALGYGGDQRLMGSIAETLPWRELSARLVAAPQDQRIALAEASLRDAAGLAATHGGEAPRPNAWSPGRPVNQPARRLAGLAQLLVRHRPLVDGFSAPGNWLEASNKELIAAWSVTGARSPGALIGRSRAVELLVNAVLPWAAALAESRGDREAAAQARACFALLPRPGTYGALTFLEVNLRVDGRSLPLNARRQQGLLALYKTDCTQGGCGRCPLS
jgi:hypothetical protein